MSPSRTQPSAQRLYRRPAAAATAGAASASGTATSPTSAVPQLQQVQHQPLSPLSPPPTHHPQQQQQQQQHQQPPSHYDKHQRLEGPGTPLGNPVSIALDARKLSPSGNVQVQTTPPTNAGVAPTSASSSAAPSASGTPNTTPTRRRTQGLRSPLVKRPPGAPVTMQGWLHKQGSDGLMLWRKRWFVLCDYCLFYYKGPEEEKLLGSILLPSYTISACTTDTNSSVGVGGVSVSVGVGRGGVGRKFAFKAEHANMRTYYFAADSHALMLQWMHALSLASLVQDRSSYDDSRRINYNSNVGINQNMNLDDNESGFATYRPRQQQPTYGHQVQPQSPQQQQLTLNFHQNQLMQQQQQHGMTNGWRPIGMDPRQHPQHLYANAPPKPRRMANEDNPVESSSPEWSSPDGPPMMPLSHFQQTERRTPDTYGRSLAATPAPPSGSIPPPGPAPGLPQITRPEDYEDVFNERAWVNQRDRPGQMAYLQTSSKTRATIITESLQTTYHRQQKRPRSADFLDYDARRYGVQSPDRDIAGHLDQPSYQLPSVPSSHTLSRLQPQPQTAQPQQPARPKSSLDTSFWSEESYAQEMRETAYLLQARSPLSSTQPLLPMSQSVQQFQQHQQQEQQFKLLEEQDLLLQRRWSEYADLRTGERSGPGDRDGSQPFLRSASARLPRRYRGPEDDSDDDRDGRGSSGSSVHYQQRRNSASGDRKVQQREESMKRLLEWKQRMLQSPLSRKPSGSSTRGVNAVQNQLSHFYRQQVLRELATQEARAKEIADRDAEALAQAEQENTRIQLQKTTLEDRTNSTDSWNLDNHIPRSRNVATNRAMQLDVARNSRKKVQDDLGRPTLRSRSQEGRRSSNSSRFNSYSSDDEELGDVRESRRRSRRPSRRNSSSASAAATTTASPTSATAAAAAANSGPDYENVAMICSAGRSSNVLPPASPPAAPDSGYDTLQTSTAAQLDESWIVREFSYQYIKHPKVGEEAEKPSPPPPPPKQPKSVKDLLADFERKSEQVRQQQAAEERRDGEAAVAKRGVFSDTETLLYDTSSEAEPERDHRAPPAPLETLPPPPPPLQPIIPLPDEEHYMPMTPSKKALPEALFKNIFGSSVDVDMEESSYVEMTTGGLTRSLLAPASVDTSVTPTVLSNTVGTLTTTSADSTLGGQSDQNGDLGFSSSGGSGRHYEPVYMEVSVTGSELSTSVAAPSPRPALPDILAMQPASGQTKSDSSDADDEASKDLDSLDTPRPRFSLSDTFRPASYYLGAELSAPSGGVNGDHPDSSDSDLVSPPPIPLDELETSLEAEPPQRPRRRPPSGSDLDLDSVGSRSGLDGESVDLDLDKYLGGYLRAFHKERYSLNENLVGPEKGTAPIKSFTASPLPPPLQEVLYENLPSPPSPPPPLTPSTPPPPLPEPDREIRQTIPQSVPQPEQTVSQNSPQQSQYTPYQEQQPQEDTPQQQQQPSTQTPNHHHQSSSQSQVSPSSAPYYYSDLLKPGSNTVLDTSMNPSRQRHAPLNNQRDDVVDLSKRNDIGRRVNPINHGLQGSSPSPPASPPPVPPTDEEGRRLAEEVRSTSVHFLGADKCGRVDRRNLYEADTLQRRRACTASGLSAPGQHNLFPQGIRDKSRSLEGLLDDAPPMDQDGGTGIIDRLLRGAAPSELAAVALTVRSSQSVAPPPSQNDPLWEEDSLWRENLRRASLRHTRSMDDLDEPSASGRRRRVSRDVTYVNEQRHGGALSRREYEEDYREGRRARPPSSAITSTPVAAPSPPDDGVHYERLARFSTESLERTRRGQTFLDGYGWDADRETFYKNEPFLESCPPPPHQVPDALPAAGQQSTIAPQVDPPPPPPEPRPTSPVSSLVGRDPVGEEDLLGNGGIVGSRTPLLPFQPLCSSQPTLPPPSSDSRDSGQISRSSTVDLLSGVVDLSNNNNLVNGSLSPTSEDWRNRDFRDSWQARNQNKRRGGSSPSTCGGGGSGEPFSLQVSAGELLGRTHEELVLLLIQLRRASAAVCKAMETCHVEIEAQARLAELETPRRVEHLHKLDDLKRQLQELEKQYEKGKPLVNLVDNMVKLGSLYREGVSPYSVGLHSPSTPNLDPLPLRQRLEFNHKVQEQRLLAEERRDWDRLSLDHSQLQAKVQHLYRLDQLMREESGTLQSLQQDKELLERALGGLRHKLHAAHTRPAEAEQYRKQQRLLERELSRVRLLLAHNSKKLEETVAENARLEQELVILRQKLQASRQPYYSASACVSPATSMLGGFHDSPPSPATPTTPTAVLEAELRRVQRLVGDLQRQRQELSLAVRQLTEKSNTLSEQIRPGPTGVAGAGPILGRKRQQSSWLETDLDSLVTRDLGTESQQTSPTEGQSTSTPLYVNTELALSPTTNGVTSTETTFNSSTSSDPLAYAQIELSEADDRMKRFYGIIPREKQQEIKTVRIVKRESERRQRDRDRSGNVGIPLLGTTGPGAKRIGFSDEHLDSTLLGQVLESEETPLRQTTSSQALDEAMARLDDELHSAIGSTSSSLGPPRSMSLPRGFGKTNSAGLEVDSIPSLSTSLRSASPRIDSGAAMRNAMLRKQRVRFDPTAGSGSESSTGSPSANRALSAREQLFGSGVDDHTLLAIGSRDPSPQLSPVYSNHSVYQSEVARQIVMEMKGSTPPMPKLPSSQLLHSKSQDLEQKEEEKDKENQENQESSSQENGLSPEQPQGAVRRAVPREKRRHHTVSSSRPLSHTPSSAFPSMGYARSRDDLDMERALRPRLNAPDVVRSTLSRRTPRYDADTIDSLLGTPGKIHIPERYVPENEPALSREEQLQRIRKADAIRKMLTETRSSTTLPTAKSPGEEEDEEEEPSSTLKKKMEEEKKQREHLLQLNQILAKQVMEKSKLVAAKAMAEQTPASEPSGSEEDLSPATPLPLYQQRDNFYS